MLTSLNSIHSLHPPSAPFTARILPLHPAAQGQVGVFLGADGKRVSQHFYNLEAAREWLRAGNGTCPMSRLAVQVGCSGACRGWVW